MRKGSFAISTVGVFLVAFVAMAQAQNTITTLAGGGPTGLAAKSSGLGTPWGVVQDSKGNTYISDNLSNRVFKVDGSGNVTVAAGNILAFYNINGHGDGNLANTAPLNTPQGIALDSMGNVYIADTGNNAIRVVNTQSSSITLEGLTIPAGVIETIAGDGNGTACSDSTQPCGDGGPATSASLNAPSGVWLDTDGNVYIADTLDSRIRVVNMQATAISFPGTLAGTIQPGNIATIVGTGTAGFGDGAITTAQINSSLGIFVTGAASQGNIVIVVADTMNNRIRAVNTSTSISAGVAGVSIPVGDIGTVAGNGTEGYAGDGNPGIDPGTELNHPSAAVMDGSGNLYIADGDNLPPPQNVVTSNEVIRKVDTANTITTFAGTNGTQCSNFNLANNQCGDGGPATSANLWAPTGVFVNGSGNLLIADQNDDAIREVSGGNIQTLMGSLLNTSYSPFPATLTSKATAAGLRQPAGVASDAAGNAYIADTFNNAIRKVDTSGVISTVVGNGLPCNTLTCGDGGPASLARVSGPFDVAFDNAGNLYIADSDDEVIRVVNNQSTPITIAGQTIQPGTILTVAGNGTPCASAPCGDGSPSTSAQLNSPDGVFVDNAGTIFIADTGDNAIRVVNPHSSGSIVVVGVTIPAGTIVTVAGAADPSTACANPLAGNCGDAGLATSAQLNAPGGAGVDSFGNVYISDTGDNRVRIVDHASGLINAFAGTGAPCVANCLNNGPALDALLDAPQNLFVDLAGNVFIADAKDFEVREVTRADGNIQGVAGDETIGFSGDGGPATNAQLRLPFGVRGDPFGNLLIADFFQWRVRKVTGLVVTAPRAEVSPASVIFPAQAIGTKSAAIPVTVSNVGNGTNLTVAGISISGANKSDFAQTNNCNSVPGPGSCTIDVTITPQAAGARNGLLMVTYQNAGSPQSVNLSGTGQDFTLPSTGVLSPASIPAGGSATATITIAPGKGLNADVTLSCAVTSPSKLSPVPTCALNPTQLTPGKVTSTLTVTPIAGTAVLTVPGIVHRSAPMYAVWLLLPGTLLSTAGIGVSRRRRLLSYLLVFFAIAGCLFLVACGGGSSGGSGSGGGGGGTPGTPAGPYVVTVTAKTGTTTATQTLNLTVQ